MPEKRDKAPSHSHFAVTGTADEDGRVWIRWDPENEAPRQADGGWLEVEGTDSPATYAVTPETLRRGKMDFRPHAGATLARLILTSNGQRAETATLRLTTPPPPPVKIRPRVVPPPTAAPVSVPEPSVDDEP